MNTVLSDAMFGDVIDTAFSDVIKAFSALFSNIPVCKPGFYEKTNALCS